LEDSILDNLKKIIKMKIISEHSIEETLIDKKGWVLDLGCIDFSFAKEIKKYCDNVICVDPNPNIKEIPSGLIYENLAITHLDNVNEQSFYIYNDIQGYSLLNPSKDWCVLQKIITVKVTTIKKIMEKYGIKKFELIKFDIEGSEYEILRNIDWSISKQYSVEFHDFRFMNPYYPDNDKYYTELFKKFEDKMTIIKHELTDHPGFGGTAGRNYWDSLFIEKNN
jgi:FkbM family methyltransferase